MIDKANIRRNLSRLMAAKAYPARRRRYRARKLYSICFANLIISRRTVKTYSPFP